MNFEKVEMDLYEGREVKLSQKGACKFLFYMIEQYAKEGEREEYEPEQAIESIKELTTMIDTIVECAWSRVILMNHPMAASQIIMKEGE